MFRTLALTFALGLALSAAPACAETIPDIGMSPASVVSWLQREGFQAKIADQRDSGGYLYVETSSDGVNWEVDFYDCDKSAAQNCRSLQFTAGWNGTYTLDLANRWNKDFRYAKAHINADGSTIWVQQDVLLAKGMTISELDENFDLWVDTIPDFSNHIAKK